MMNIRLVFVRPPKSAQFCYALGLPIVIFAVLAMKLQWDWISVVVQQQLLIGGAIVCLLGSLINWMLPMLKNKGSKI